jgi:hypothetical protein
MEIIFDHLNKYIKMYGIVNKAIEDLVISNFGDEKWDAVKNA